MRDRGEVLSKISFKTSLADGLVVKSPGSHPRAISKASKILAIQHVLVMDESSQYREPCTDHRRSERLFLLIIQSAEAHSLSRWCDAAIKAIN